MEESEVNKITAKVLHNCRIADSRYSGLHSICGLAMRMRDLFKWENSLEPWVERDSSEVLEWIGKKEEEWDRLANREFEDIIIQDSRYDPFNTKEINELLEPHGLYYGAGYAGSLRPTFFLANMEAKKRMDGHAVYILGREQARDLLTLPALVQDQSILIRKESGILFFWDKIFFINDSGRKALGFALKGHGIDPRDHKALQKNLRKLFSAEIGRYVHHELGEIKDPVFDRDLWREIVATFPHSAIELIARTLKDLLADTTDHGTLKYIIRQRNGTSLAFYVAFLDGLAKKLFCQLDDAFPEFSRTHNWRLIEETVSDGYRTFTKHAERMSAIFREGRKKKDMDWTARQMEKHMLTPLGLVSPIPPP